MRSGFCSCVLLAWLAAAARADPAADLLQEARAALAKGQAETALERLNQALAQDGKNVQALLLRGTVYELLRRHAQAVADFDRVIALDPQSAEAYNRRGSERFKLGQVAGSIADFDRYVELRPEEKNGHWKRGISYYYAGRFDDGRKQFEGYEQVDTNDVENAVWHFLCHARLVGVDKARSAMLKIGNDKRVPMMQVYELFLGKLKPDDVLAAAKAGTPPPDQLNQRLFYAHLYLALFHEALGDKKRTREHLDRAVEHKIGHYMWDVARVHRELLEK